MTFGQIVRRVGALLMVAGLVWAAATLLMDTGRGAEVYAQEDPEDEGNAAPSSARGASVEPTGPLAECPPGQVALDFVEDMDIRLVVKMIAKKLNKALLLDRNVTGNITIVAPNRCMSPQAAYDVFLSILRLNGLATVQVGDVVKIVKTADAQSQPIPTVTGESVHPNEGFITQLIPLKNIDAVELATSFRPLIGPDGNIFAYGPSNMLIILDSAANIDRILQIIKKLDVEGTEELIEVVPIEYASADMLADVVTQLFEDEARVAGGMGGLRGAAQSAAQNRISQLRQRMQQRRPGLPGAAGAAGGLPGAAGGGFSESIAANGTIKIIADMRTNSLVIKANRYMLKRIREVIARLDAPLPGGEGKIHVVYLENANADELAALLADLAGTGGTGGVGRTTSSRSRTGQRGSQASSVANAFANRFGGAGGLGSAAGGLGAGGIQRTGTGAAGELGNPTRSVGQVSGRFLADFDGSVRITSDPATNSLVIIASNRDFEILREVIAKLDIPRPQVFVEVMIVELTVERGLDVGFEFRSTSNPTSEGVQVVGGTNYGGIQSAAVNPLGITGFALGAADGTITFNGETFLNVGALFRAMQDDRDVNILATPHILTTDNEEAEIVIANNIPFITGQIYSSNFNNPATTIERRDVGITLRINPQINESDMVRLTIYQESSSVTDSPAGLAASQVGVTTAKRSADTVVVVKSRQTVVIGGLMQDNITYTEAKVPVLGDIPLLGYLFKSSRRTIEKTNLLIFITPYIIKDNGDLEEITRRSNYRLQQYREQNRLERRLGGPNERQMSPNNRVFRRGEQEVIETDPGVRGSSVQPPPPPSGSTQPQGNDAQGGDDQEAEPTPAPTGSDEDFGGSQ